MVLIPIKHTEAIQRHSGVPSNLVDFLTAAQWNEINIAMAQSFEKGNMWGCGIELVICLICAFPCIFLCHPCISGAVMANDMEQ